MTLLINFGKSYNLVYVDRVEKTSPFHFLIRPSLGTAENGNM